VSEKDERLLSKRFNKFFWTDSYLIIAEQEFDNVFSDIYEDEFINAIFETHEALIERQDFIDAITGNVEKNEPEAQWLFSPSRIRDIFKTHLLSTKSEHDICQINL
jgi:hypothetical protein